MKNICLIKNTYSTYKLIKNGGIVIGFDKNYISERAVFDKDGNFLYIKYFDDEYKIWVTLRCNPNNNNGGEIVKKHLKEIALNQFNLF